MKIRLYDVLALPSWEVRDIGRRYGVDRWVQVRNDHLLEALRDYTVGSGIDHAVLIQTLPGETHEVPDRFAGAPHLGVPVTEDEVAMTITNRPEQSGLLLNRVYGMDLLMLSYWHRIEEGV